MIILSICIPTTPERHEMFTKLFNELHAQLEYMQTFHSTLGDIEILVDDSKRFLDGGLSIGKKRESLVKRARGKYVCFLDSDDWISPRYLETLVRLCIQDKDVCTFRNVSKFDNYWCIVDMSLDTMLNQQATDGDLVMRRPWHITPVKRDYAILYDFPNTNYGEDWEWFDKVLSHCKTQAKSNAIIHEYRHSRYISQADEIFTVKRAANHS